MAKLETYNARLDALMREQSRQFTEKLTPFLIEFSQAAKADENNFQPIYKALTENVTRYACSILVSSGMNIAHSQDLGEKLTRALISVTEKKAERYMADLRTGLQSPVRCTEFDIATGKPVPFDFRDHITRDSGRASSVGG